MKLSFFRLLLAATLVFMFHANIQAEVIDVRIKTNKGDIDLELYSDKAPQTVANFLKYVDEGFYDGTIFHRVINSFMIQGGGFTEQMQRKRTRDPIKNEAKNGLKNVRGSVAMARTRAPHSASSQFFINHADNKFLDYPGQDGWGYAVFGKVTNGMETVDAIADVMTVTKNGMRNVPEEAVVIQSVSRISNDNQGK